jgi:hypothetical protein
VEGALALPYHRHHACSLILIPHFHVVQVPEFVVVSGANTLKVSEYFEAIGTRAARNACSWRRLKGNVVVCAVCGVYVRYVR